MKDTSSFRGTWTALITPFTSDLKIDYDALRRLIVHQVENGVTGILLNGTTGESPTLTESEVVEMIRFSKELIANRCGLMVGCGTNDTQKSIHQARVFTQAGAESLLLACPYYNKPTQQGLFLHFKAISEATALPLFLYSIKGRSGVNIEIDTVLRLAEAIPHLYGIKEASGDVEQIAEISRRRPQGFLVFSGDDGITASLIEQHGIDGVISVASNVHPDRVAAMVKAGLSGDFSTLHHLDQALQPLFKNLFLETNPIPVKYVMHRKGFCEGTYRLPLCAPSETTQSLLNASSHEF